MEASTRRLRAGVSTVVSANARRIAAGMFAVSALAAGDRIGEWSEVHASHNTCGAINQAGGEASLVARAKETLNGRLPQSHSGKVTVSQVPAAGGTIRLDVEATIKKPVKSVTVTCASSTFSARLDIRVKVSGLAGRSTHEGDGKIAGHYLVYSSNPSTICVKNLRMVDLNLQGVQHDIDSWIRQTIDESLIAHDICAP